MLASCQAPFTAISNSEGEKDEKKNKSYSRRWCRFWVLTSTRRFLRHEELGERWDVCKLCCWWFVLVYSLFFMAQWWQGKRQFARMWNAITREMWRWKSVRIRIYITIGNSFFLPHRCNNLRGISFTAVVRLCVLRHSLSLFFRDIFFWLFTFCVFRTETSHRNVSFGKCVCAPFFRSPFALEMEKHEKRRGDCCWANILFASTENITKRFKWNNSECVSLLKLLFNLFESVFMLVCLLFHRQRCFMLSFQLRWRCFSSKNEVNRKISIGCFAFFGHDCKTRLFRKTETGQKLSQSEIRTNPFETFMCSLWLVSDESSPSLEEQPSHFLSSFSCTQWKLAKLSPILSREA